MSSIPAEVLDEYGLDLWLLLGKGNVKKYRSLEAVRHGFCELKGLDAVFVPDRKYPALGPVALPETMRPLEFDVPREATADGVLNLE